MAPLRSRNPFPALFLPGSPNLTACIISPSLLFRLGGEGYGSCCGYPWGSTGRRALRQGSGLCSASALWCQGWVPRLHRCSASRSEHLPGPGRTLGADWETVSALNSLTLYSRQDCWPHSVGAITEAGTLGSSPGRTEASLGCGFWAHGVSMS